MDIDTKKTNSALLSVVLGSFNRKNFLKLTIESIRKELVLLDFKTEIIVLDGGSTDGTIKWLTEQKDIISIIQHNRGSWEGKPISRRSWGYFMNLAFKAAQGKYICMLSDDCLVIPNAIVNAYNLFEEKLKLDKKIGGLAFYYRDWPDEKEYHVNITIENTIMINHGLFLKKALEDVNYINEDDYSFYHADDDLALTLKQAGYEIAIAENSYIEHFLHANIKLRQNIYENERDDFTKLINKWKDILKIDNECNIKFGMHKKKFVFELPELNMFLKFFKKELNTIKRKKNISKTAHFFKKTTFQSFYIFKYFSLLFFLLFTNPKQFYKKIKSTYHKHFKN